MKKWIFASAAFLTASFGTATGQVVGPEMPADVPYPSSRRRRRGMLMRPRTLASVLVVQLGLAAGCSPQTETGPLAPAQSDPAV
jgi:hypothetical protein